MRVFASTRLLSLTLLSASILSCASLRASPFDRTGIAFDKLDAKFKEHPVDSQPEVVLNLRQDRNYNEFRKTIRAPTRVVGIVTVREDIRNTYDYLLKKVVMEGRVHGCDFLVEYALHPDVWTLRNRGLTHDYIDWQFTCEVPEAAGDVAVAAPPAPERHCSPTTQYGELCFESLYPHSPL